MEIPVKIRKVYKIKGVIPNSATKDYQEFHVRWDRDLEMLMGDSYSFRSNSNLLMILCKIISTILEYKNYMNEKTFY